MNLESDGPCVRLARMLTDMCDGYISREGACFATFGEVGWALDVARNDLEARWIMPREEATAADAEQLVFEEIHVMADIDVDKVLSYLKHSGTGEDVVYTNTGAGDVAGEPNQLFCDNCGRYIADARWEGPTPRVTCGECILQAMPLRED